MRRPALLATLLLLPVLPGASAALGASAAGPAGAVPLDGSATLTVTVTLDCADLAVRGGQADIALSVTSAMPFTFQGPASLKASAAGCDAAAPPTWTGTATYAINGTRFIPGLVAHQVNVTASLPAGPVAAAAPAATKDAQATITPAAVVEYAFEPVHVLPSENRGEPAPIAFAFTSRSNVPLTAALQASGRDSRDLTGKETLTPLPQGTLTLPPKIEIPAATLAGAPGTANGTALYRAPAGRAGVDGFRLVASARPTVDPNANATVREADVSVSFDLRPVETAPTGTAAPSTGPAGRIGHDVDPVPPPAAPAPGALVGLALLGLAAASRRRRA